MAQRVTYRRRLSYNTNSNKHRVVKTPGGKLVYQRVRKLTGAPKCGDCGDKLAGVSPQPPLRQLRPYLPPPKVRQPSYGGSRCATCVRSRIVRAFLIEEQKIVKKVLKAQQIEAKPVKPAVTKKKVAKK
ncbi:ribosomal protein L34e-domain-containing protein [Chytridium lagenaria]|nr:ribosomal protein L34e-domain-containing protein [Chytridium lagenaria]